MPMLSNVRPEKTGRSLSIVDGQSIALEYGKNESVISFFVNYHYSLNETDLPTGFLFFSGNHRNRVKSSEPETSISLPARSTTSAYLRRASFDKSSLSDALKTNQFLSRAHERDLYGNSDYLPILLKSTVAVLIA
jgi:hypothetical protein